MVDSLQPEKVISAVAMKNPFVEDTFQNSTQMEFSLLVCCFVSFFCNHNGQRWSVAHQNQAWDIAHNVLSLICIYCRFGMQSFIFEFFLCQKFHWEFTRKIANTLYRSVTSEKYAKGIKSRQERKKKITMRKKRGANQRSWCT